MRECSAVMIFFANVEICVKLNKVNFSLFPQLNFVLLENFKSLLSNFYRDYFLCFFFNDAVFY
jgi:hypothetical protein